MLIALYFWIQATFGGVAPLEDRIHSVVEDPERLQAALVVAGRIEALDERLASEVERTKAALRKLHSRPDATRADYLRLLTPLEETRREVFTGLLAARADLRSVMTRTEWAEVFPAEE